MLDAKKLVVSRHDPITDQQAVELLAKEYAYNNGVDYRDVLSVWAKLDAYPEGSPERERATKSLFAELKTTPAPRHSFDAVRKFLARVHPSGKPPKMLFMRQCVTCECYFGTESRKTKHCSIACRTTAEARPEGYFAEKQRECRVEKRNKSRPRVKASSILAAWRERQRTARS
jgi:hypothetical protein